MPGRRAESLRSPDPAWPIPRPRGARVDHCNPLGLGYGLALPLPRGQRSSAYLPGVLFAALDSDGTHLSHYLKGLGLLP